MYVYQEKNLYNKQQKEKDVKQKEKSKQQGNSQKLERQPGTDGEFWRAILCAIWWHPVSENGSLMCDSCSLALLRLFFVLGG